MVTKDIKQFRGRHRFLSNFFPCFIEVDGEIYPTVEHAFQAAKTYSTNKRWEIRKATTAREAKRLGRRVALRNDWEKVKLEIMKQLVSTKFSDPELADLLRQTGDGELIEGNWWGDTFWGVCDGMGKNHLGKILMEVRSKL